MPAPGDLLGKVDLAAEHKVALDGEIYTTNTSEEKLMDLASFIIASVVCITVICYLAATAIKQTPLANKWLPSICGALGGLLGLAAMYINVPDFPATDPLTALAVGIVSGLAATGADQVIKQIGKDN